MANESREINGEKAIRAFAEHQAREVERPKMSQADAMAKLVAILVATFKDATAEVMKASGLGATPAAINGVIVALVETALFYSRAGGMPPQTTVRRALEGLDTDGEELGETVSDEARRRAREGKALALLQILVSADESDPRLGEAFDRAIALLAEEDTPLAADPRASTEPAEKVCGARRMGLACELPDGHDGNHNEMDAQGYVSSWGRGIA